MYRPLAPCPSCHRHVQASEGACPFCAAPLGKPMAVPSLPNVGGRLARGALFVFASSVGVVACGSSTDTPTPTDTGVTDTGGPAPAYGAPADTGSTVDTGTLDSGATDGTVDDTGGPMPKYGAPPPPDAG